MWLDWVFSEVFGLAVRLESATADLYFDTINEQLAQPAFRPRALFERFNIEVLATTESPTDPLRQHQAIRASGWKGRVITAFRPDPVIDPQFDGFHAQLRRLGELTGEDTGPLPRLPRGAAQSSRLFCRPGRDLHGSRPSHRADRGSLGRRGHEPLFQRVTRL